MDKNKQKLIDLIKDMNFPVTSVEIEEQVEKLGDEDVQNLLKTYQDLKLYEDAIDKVARQINPEKYKEIEEEYQKKLKKIDEEYENEMEKIQEDADTELDATEAKAVRETEEEIKKTNEVVDTLIKARDDLYSKLRSVIGE